MSLKTVDEDKERKEKLQFLRGFSISNPHRLGLMGILPSNQPSHNAIYHHPILHSFSAPSQTNSLITRSSSSSNARLGIES